MSSRLKIQNPKQTAFLNSCFPKICAPKLNSEKETTDSADFTDFQEVIGDERTNLFVAKLQGIHNRNLLYPWNLRNLRLNPFRFFDLSAEGRA